MCGPNHTTRLISNFKLPLISYIPSVFTHLGWAQRSTAFGVSRNHGPSPPRDGRVFGVTPPDIEPWPLSLRNPFVFICLLPTCISMGLPCVNHASGLSPLTQGVRAWHALVRRRGRLERFRDGSRVDKHTPSVWDTGKEISMQAADWALRKGGLPGPLRVSRGPSGPIGTRGFPAEHCWEVGLVQCPLTWSVTTAKH